jgi:RNA-binding protein 39
MSQHEDQPHDFSDPRVQNDRKVSQDNEREHPRRESFSEDQQLRKRSFREDDYKNDQRRGNNRWSSESSQDERRRSDHVRRRDNDRFDRDQNYDRPRQGSSDAKEPEVFVSELNFDSNPKQIKDYFSYCGDVTFVKLLKRPDGKSKGKCFVKFRDEKAQRKALDMDGESFMGRRIVVEMPKNESEVRDRNFQERQPDRPRDRPREQNNENSIVVKNLSFKMTEQSLGEFFEDCGEIQSVKILYDRDGRSRGLGFVDFRDENSVEKALQKNGENLQGRSIGVDRSNNRGNNRRGDDRRDSFKPIDL